MAKIPELQLIARRNKAIENKKVQDLQDKIDRFQFDLQQMRDTRPQVPHYTFNVGDQVMLRHGYPMTIDMVYDDGLFYLVKYDYIEAAGEFTKEIHHKGESLWYWHDLQPYRPEIVQDKSKRFSKFDESRLNFSQRSIDSLLMTYYKWYLDMSPEYQRGNVWTQAQKELLIESIFENRDIGKFVIIMRPFSNNRSDPHAEILDGKQRLTALVEFYENRFSYKGVYFNDLHWRDQIHFERYSVGWAEMNERTTREQKLQYFLKLNVAGMPQSKDHIEFVQSLLDEVKE